MARTRGANSRFQHRSALFGDPERGTENRLRRGRSETDEQFRLHDSQFGFHPRPAGGDLARVRFLMDAPFAARLPFEMLHGIGDINVVAIDPRFFQARGRAACPPGRQTACRQGPPDRPVVRPASSAWRASGLRRKPSASRVCTDGKRCTPSRPAATLRRSSVSGTGAGRHSVSSSELCCFRFALLHHRFHPSRRLLEERRDQRRFRQVPPIFLRHLGLHRVHFHARRIENVCVIRQPERLDVVLCRRLRFVDARR